MNDHPIEETTETCGRQAPSDVWSTKQLIELFKNQTVEQSIATAKRAGILDENGNLTEFYTRDDSDFISRACSEVYL